MKNRLLLSSLCLALLLWGCATVTIPPGVTFHGSAPSWSWTGDWEWGSGATSHLVQDGNCVYSSGEEGLLITGHVDGNRVEGEMIKCCAWLPGVGLATNSLHMVMSDDGLYAKGERTAFGIGIGVTWKRVSGPPQTSSADTKLSQAVAPSECTATAEQRRIQDQWTTRGQAAFVGTFLGALAGGAVGSGVGGDATSTNLGAATGAATGRGAGSLVGNEIAKRKRQYATEEAFLDGELQNAAEFNKAADRYNRQLGSEIAYLDKTSAQLKARYNAGRVSRRELEAKKWEVEQKLEESGKMYGNLKKEYDIKVALYQEQQKKRHPNDTYLVQLQQEIRQLKANLGDLYSESAQLARIDERLAR